MTSGHSPENGQEPSEFAKPGDIPTEPSVTSLVRDIEKMDLTARSRSPQMTKETAIFIQDACLQHRFIRSRDTSTVVERPERLRAVNIGLAAAMARLEESTTRTKIAPVRNSIASADSTGDLATALGRMNLATPAADPLESQSLPVSVVKSFASVDLLNHPAVKFIHGDVDGDVYLDNLKTWAKISQETISKGGSEIPVNLPQNDLYLCPTSVDAIQGAIGTVCEAVDAVVNRHSALQQYCKRAFVSIRPPGHHCGEDTPEGFCFVNNVAIAAAHAHLQHGIQRVVILDIDLHHGNGTQSIVWQINEETYRQTLESEYSGAESECVPPEKPGLKVYYGSIHDILSYPCENGKLDLVQAASVSLHGSHGQHIENVHLQPYISNEHFFDVLYKEQYSKLLKKAEEFIEGSGGVGDDVLVFISSGFDACEHEYPSMSRHGRKVPTSFFHRFTVDACSFADKYAQGRLVSVLEGGYSDRALISGAMAHLCGMVRAAEGRVDERWWAVENLEKLEKATRKRRGGKQSISTPGSPEPWLDHAVAIFSSLDAGSAKYMTQASSMRPAIVAPPSSMTLRERKKPVGLGVSVDNPFTLTTMGPNTAVAKITGRRSQSPPKQPGDNPSLLSGETLVARGGRFGNSASNIVESSAESSEPVAVPKKLPRVILRMGPPPGASSS